MQHTALKTNVHRLGEGNIGSVIGAVIFIAAVVYFNLPAWEDLATDRNQVVKPGMAFIQGIEIYRQTKVRVTASDKDHKPISVYYLNDADHRKVQAGQVDEVLLQRVDTQSLVVGGELTTPREQPLDQGIFHFYFANEEEDGGEDRTISYNIEIYN